MQIFKMIISVFVVGVPIYYLLLTTIYVNNSKKNKKECLTGAIVITVLNLVFVTFLLKISGKL